MNSYGLVFGGEKTSHDSGNDIAYKVVSGNNYSQVVIEGDEYILPKEAMQSEKVYDFVDKLPIEMLDEIKRSENVFIQFPNLRQGDMVVCKNSVRNDDLHTIKGTAKEIANYLQGLSACRMYAKGGYISGELANGGGVEDESQLRLLTPMPPTKLGKTGIDSLTEIVGKDELREAMSGALYAGKGRIVATDAHILVVLENQNYPKSLDGTIKSLWNKVPQERLIGIPYPNWEAVVPNQQIFQTKELSIDDVLAYAYGGFLEGKNIIKEKDFNKYQKEKFKYVLRLNIGNIEIGIDSLLLTRILRTLKANDVRKISLHITEKHKPIKITTDNKHYGLIMPVMIADKVEDLGEGIYVSQQIFYPISDKDFRAMSKKYGEYLTEFSKMVGGERMAEGGEITMNVPLLLRVLELAKEDVKEDKELHFIAERLQSLSKKGTLTMEDYDYISGWESNDKIQKLIAENDSNDSDLRFEQGGGGITKKSELLAPNGKPSNLTPEQWHLVRTPEFKAWFGDWEALENAKLRDKGMDEVTLKNLASNVSKVVDENGEPLVVWHFAKRLQYELDKFYTFNVDKQLGSHFGTLNQAQNLKYLVSGGDGVVKPTKDIADFRYYQVFLNIKNPIRLKDVGIFEEESILEEIEKTIRPIKEYELEYFNNRDRKETRLNKIKDWLLKNFQIDGVVYLNRYETNAPMSLINSLDDASDESFKSKIKDAEDSWIAFYPNQIKLADGSNTTFDFNNPDIRYEQGGGIKKKSELLAPNGKPSNLTPEQWHLVRTPQFKAWFGDWENDPENASKVVDKNGEPLVLYRGNEEQMGKYGFEFKLGLNLLRKPNKNDFGFFFTDDLEVAKKYRKVDFDDSYIAGSITPIFLKAVKVLDLSDFGDKVWQEEFVVGLDEKGIKFDSFEHLPNKIINYFDEGGSYKGWGNNTFDYFDVFPELRDLFLANGYEAVLFKEISRHYFPYNVFVAFHSNQIKLADGSNTTFDANNPDIRFEQGGGVNKSNQTNDYLKVTKIEEYDDGDKRVLITAHFGRNGTITWEIPNSQIEAGQKNNPDILIVQSIDKNRAENPHYAKDSKGEGTKAIKSLFDKYPSLKEILYDDYSDGFWQKIGGDIDSLSRTNFFKYYDNKLKNDANKEKLADGSNTKFDSNNPDIRFEQGGGIEKKSELLAPNGKPSNLTPEQWHLVRTPEFKAWFGDWEALENAKMRDRGMDEITLNQLAKNVSKVVDENGEPLVCNHSSREQDIDVFDGNRIFRTPNIQVKPIWFSYEGFYGKDDDILQYHCFLNVKKLFYFDKKQDLLILENYMNEKYNNYDIDSDYDYSTNWEAIEDENLPAYIFELGFDGYITNIENAVVVYNSNQIKLADGSNTTFDANNPDIRFEQGGGVLLAPNGKPSNLNPEQWHLVRTPQFKAWFGDWENDPENASKVVDKNGEPLVVWHGSKSKEDFNVFKQQQRFEFIYFAENKHYAKYHFSKWGMAWSLRPFFLNIRNLLNAEEYSFDKIKFNELKLFFFGIYDLEKDIQLNPKKEYRFWEILRHSNDLYDSLKQENYYDGISFYENFYEDTTFLDTDDFSLSYVVMNPNQIKLADGSNTTFDSNNSDIRFVEGGQIENERSIFGNSTGLKKYDILLKQGKAKIYEIQPDDFINHIPSLEEIEKNPKLKRRWVRPNINPKTDIQVQNLINKIKLGIELDMPIIDEDFYDGMHRSFALKELGIKKMPVVITNDYWKNSTFKIKQ